jgi:hypothetical protein
LGIKSWRSSYSRHHEPENIHDTSSKTFSHHIRIKKAHMIQAVRHLVIT